MYKIEKEVAPFIVNCRLAWEQIEDMMNEFNFLKGEGWQYDPHHITSDRILRASSWDYIHDNKLELKKLANQEGWISNSIGQNSSEVL